ncbi:MAG: hypothetical protein LUB59_05480 [Candidatus Gastranaerophilales bacterium]|nr:hypothetical protein [Candidatus Gastranaerophilales bacterium]
MNISGLNSYNIIPLRNSGINTVKVCSFANEPDSFEKQSSTVFTGKIVKQKKLEDVIRNIDGLHDPYSDVLMISKNKFTHLKQKISKSADSRSMITLLSGYQEHMFEPEKQVFDILKEKTRQAYKSGQKGLKELTFHSILQDMLPEAKQDLVTEQLNVIDNIRKISNSKLTKNSGEKVNKVLDSLQYNVHNDNFRLQSSLDEFRQLKKHIPEKEVLDEIMLASETFPGNATSKDAFIVKNAGKTPEEIAELLVKPSLISVEHIRAYSKGGESAGKNYIAASTRMNNLRKSMPLNEFIKRYPEIPQQTQRYIDEIISKINRGGLRQVACDLPDIKKTLYEQSNGLIDVNIDGINKNVYDNIDSIKSKMDKLVKHFSKQKKYE